MIHVVAAVAVADGKLLLASRPPDKPPAGWEFPGGKIEPGETPESAVIRELSEELAWDVIPGKTIYRLEKPEITIDFIEVTPCAGSHPCPREGQSIQWLTLYPGIKAPEGLLKNDLEFWDFFSNSLK